MTRFGKTGINHLLKQGTMLTEDELSRYHRQIMLPEIGIDGQNKLKNAKVLVVGAGGIGCPVLQYLCGAGVGTIGIIDFDKVEQHNLHRQLLYLTSDIGKPKAETAASNLKQLNPNISFHVFNEVLNNKNCNSIISQFEIVIDGSDNFPTRYMVNDTCVKLNKPLIYGSILNFEAQMAVFSHKGGKNLRDIFPEPPNPEDAPGCNENGVLGVVPGILGVYMANACIQVILGIYNNNNLFVFDFLNFKMLELAMK
jgi:molybdopterin-synthase adenylyltransferase